MEAQAGGEPPTGGSDDRRWFFLHMHKAAGTTLLRRLWHEFAAGTVYPSPADQEHEPDVSYNVGRLRFHFAGHGDAVRLVAGHFPLCTADLLGVPFTVFTVLRDPVERTLSYLRRVRERDPSQRHRTLEDVYDDPVLFHGLVHNHMVKMLSLEPAEMTAGMRTRVRFDEDRLERAAANLEHRVDLFGIQERFEDFCEELAARYGWDLGEPSFTNRSRPVPVPDGLRERIAADNAADVALYRFATDLLDRRAATAAGRAPSTPAPVRTPAPAAEASAPAPVRTPAPAAEAPAETGGWRSLFAALDGDGDVVELVCGDNFVSRWTNGDILAGRTYPWLPFVDDVRVVLDVGANCGGATVYLAHHHPDAVVHAVEPAAGPRRALERNVADLPNVQVHPVALADQDRRAWLHHGAEDSSAASLHRRGADVGDGELVDVRHAGRWAAEHGIDRADVLKVSVEGSEVEVLTGLRTLLPTVKVLYVDYGSRHARRDLNRLLDGSHDVYRGHLLLESGRCVYLRHDLAELPAAGEFLLRLLDAGVSSR